MPASAPSEESAPATAQAARVVDAVHGQPFTRLLGARVAQAGDGRLEIALDIREDLTQQNGYVHGGVIGYLADNACAAAAGTVLPDGAIGSVTSEYKINILRPAIGSRAVARAEVVRRGRSQCVTEARVFTQTPEGEVLVAIALATIAYVYPGPAHGPAQDPAQDLAHGKTKG